MQATDTKPTYSNKEHGERVVTADEYRRLLEGLPVDVVATLPDFGAPVEGCPNTLADMAGILRDYMSDFVYTCQRRPLLPQEVEEFGGQGFVLTRKGSAKYVSRLTELASAFEQVFGLSVWRSGRKSPAEGPLDPLTYD